MHPLQNDGLIPSLMQGRKGMANGRTTGVMTLRVEALNLAEGRANARNIRGKVILTSFLYVFEHPARFAIVAKCCTFSCA